MSTRRGLEKQKSPGGTAGITPHAEITGSDLLPPPSSTRTPRNPSRGRHIAETPKEKASNALRQLPNDNITRPSTPLNRAVDDGVPSTQRSAHRTPGPQHHPGSIKRHAAATPHTQAAIREIELRRAAALTPGKGRRQSLRQRRDTPRDVLRALSAVLAPVTNVVEQSPETKPDNNRATKSFLADSEDEEPDLKRPRLSIPLDAEEDEDDSLLLPPISSAFLADDENLTQRSVELPRRHMSEQPRRLSRASFGRTRSSDRFELLSDAGLDAANADNFDPSFINHGVFDDDQDADDQDLSIQRDFTGDLRQIFLHENARRISRNLVSTSDTRAAEVQEDDNETTFMLAVPQSNSVPSRHSTPHGSLQLESDGEVDIVSVAEEDLTNDSEDVEEQKVDQLYTRETAGSHPQDEAVIGKQKGSKPDKKSIRVSKYGIQYPSLPLGTVRKLATTFLRSSGSAKAKISKDTLEAVMQASDWFFEQISDDLGVYSEHAGRKTIDESDVLALMKRQRQTSATTTPFALAQRHLPRELLQDLRMAPPSKAKRHRGSRRVEGREIT